MDEKRMIICAVFGGAGSLFVLVGIGFLVHWLNFVRRWCATTAIVTGHTGVDPHGPLGRRICCRRWWNSST